MGGRLLQSKELMKKMRKITKRTFAIQAEVPAIPAKPKKPAMMATTRNITAQESNIGCTPFIIILSIGPDPNNHGPCNNT